MKKIYNRPALLNVEMKPQSIVMTSVPVETNSLITDPTVIRSKQQIIEFEYDDEDEDDE